MAPKTNVILALTGLLALGALKAEAAFNYNSEDLIVAFSTSGTYPHTGNTYMVNLGALADFRTGQYADGNAHVINLSMGSVYLSDLTAAGITNLTSATWSIFGANTSLGRVAMSKPESVNGVQSSPWTGGSSVRTAQSDILSMIASIQSGTPGATSNAPNSSIEKSTDGNSYASYVFGSTSPTLAWESFNQIEGGLSQILDAYYVTNGSGSTGQLIGGFKFDSATGTITFSSDVTDLAIPEPGAAGLLALGVPLLGALRIRRRSARA